MRQPLAEMFKREPLMAEPVFQSMFGWEQTTDPNWRNYLDSQVVNSLQIGQHFSPYMHQTRSWAALSPQSNKKSIVVTSGTGSGKTECFMYPVLNDIFTNPQQGAVNAIFLYPLNALMEDQRDRLGRDCAALGNIRFAVYNGSTPEFNGPQSPYPECVDRGMIRNAATTPQILLTNPSMLEYVLLRDRDQPWIQRSQGQLRWIVIDEAHTYSGSAAVELRNQIQRILQAFGTSANQVHFACTSATIGGGNNHIGVSPLVEFVSSLTGQSPNLIEEIGGRRVVPQVNTNDVAASLNQAGIRVDTNRVIAARNFVNNREGVSLKELWSQLGLRRNQYNIEKALSIVDQLCELDCRCADGTVAKLFRLRAHFFMRTVNGVYVCPNPNCHRHSESPLGHLTSKSSQKCSCCGAPLLELVQCKHCGELLINGKVNIPGGQNQFLPLKFEAVERVEEDEDLLNDDFGGNGFVVSTDDDFEFMVGVSHHTLRPGVAIIPAEFVNDPTGNTLVTYNAPNGNPQYWGAIRTNDNTLLCPNCNVGLGRRNTKHLRSTSSHLNKTIAPVLLEQTNSANFTEWGQYISFTDSRPGTAGITMAFNVESERLYARSHLFGYLMEAANNYRQAPQYQQAENTIQALRGIANPSQQVLALIEQSENTLMAVYQPQPIDANLTDALFHEDMFSHLYTGDPNNQATKNQHRLAYKAAILRNTIGRRPLNEVSIEGLGLVTLVYPGLANIIQVPPHARQMGISLQEWKDFLKIALDFVVRMGNHIQCLSEGEKGYVRDNNMPSPIFPHNAVLNNTTGYSRWPQVDCNQNGLAQIEQNRLVLLLCAIKGIADVQELSNNILLINSTLDEAWDELVRLDILTKVSQNGQGFNNDNFYPNGRAADNLEGYYLNMAEGTQSVKIQFNATAYLCPMTRRFVDVLFRGFSPTMNGVVDRENYEMYRVTSDPYAMPKNLDDPNAVRLQNDGLWYDRMEEQLIPHNIYISAEHSAQIGSSQLESFTNAFKNNNYTLNILNCSTTMEMGVDIGSISMVLMTTVPPHASNYLQRSGRAGRAGQSKAVAFSICNNTMVGNTAFKNPMWALTANISALPTVPSEIIVQRHINSFFLRQFLANSNNNGIAGSSRVSDFFGTDPQNTGGTLCTAFKNALNQFQGDTQVQAAFRLVFPNENYSVVSTRGMIADIERQYLELHDLLFQQHQAANNNPRKASALQHQIRRIEQEMLLNFLAEKMFLPNANMPIGIIEFDHTTAADLDRKNNLLNQIFDIRRNMANTDPNNQGTLTQYNQLRQQILTLSLQYDNLQKTTVVQRDVRTGLNEYAPGQMVVIGEKNYTSSGVKFYGDFDTQTPMQYLYYCENCHHIEYLPLRPGTPGAPQNCPCGGIYRSVIDPTNRSAVTVYEPIGFRTYSHASTNRKESLVKTYYNIKPMVLEVDWHNPTIHRLHQSTGTSTGNLLYYNQGEGYGFAVCKKCGCAVVDGPNLVVDPMENHKELFSDQSCRHTGNDIERHVLFAGRFQTSVAIMRFFTDMNMNAFVNDESTVLSLGVVLKKALVDYLGIDDNEVDFGIKKERFNNNEVATLFMFDTNKGGCGYSSVLNDPNQSDIIFESAYQILLNSGCHCESEEDAACTQCLIDRNSQRREHKLSKQKALNWLSMFHLSTIPVPQNVLNAAPTAFIQHLSAREILANSIGDPNVTDITLFAYGRNINLEDWTNNSGSMGSLLHLASAANKGVHIRVCCNWDANSDLGDLLTLNKISNQLNQYDVRMVDSLGNLPRVLDVNAIGTRSYFFESDDIRLEMNENWGMGYSQFLFCENAVQNLNISNFPTTNDIQQWLNNHTGSTMWEGLLSSNRFRLGHLFSDAILPEMNHSQNGRDVLARMETILRGKNVRVSFGDEYVTSLLAVELLIRMIKNLSAMYQLNLDTITFNLPDFDSNVGWADWRYIVYPFETSEDRNEYVEMLTHNLLGIQAQINRVSTTHYRWLKLETNDGKIVEIRPDHSIAGGWWSNIQYASTMDNNGNWLLLNDEYLVEKNRNPRSNSDVLYYVIVKE